MGWKVDALKIITQALEADGYHFQLTPGGFFAMQHLYMHVYLGDVRQTGKNHFLTSSIEEAPILKALDQLEMMGCGLTLLPVDANGLIDLKALEASIRTKTALLSFSAVNALTGVVQPVDEIVKICHAKGVKVHVNANDAIPTWGVSLKEWDVDYITFGKALFSKEAIREGMVDFAEVSALAEELTKIASKRETFAMESARLRSELEAELKRVFPDCQIIGSDVARVPHICAVAFPGLMNEALQYLLHRQNIVSSIGGGQYQTLSHMLNHPGAISFMLQDTVSEEEMRTFLNALVLSVRKLQKMSVML